MYGFRGAERKRIYFRVPISYLSILFAITRYLTTVSGAVRSPKNNWRRRSELFLPFVPRVRTDARLPCARTGRIVNCRTNHYNQPTTDAPKKIAHNNARTEPNRKRRILLHLLRNLIRTTFVLARPSKQFAPWPGGILMIRSHRDPDDNHWFNVYYSWPCELLKK